MHDSDKDLKDALDDIFGTDSIEIDISNSNNVSKESNYLLDDNNKIDDDEEEFLDFDDDDNIIKINDNSSDTKNEQNTNLNTIQNNYYSDNNINEYQNSNYGNNNINEYQNSNYGNNNINEYQSSNYGNNNINEYQSSSYGSNNNINEYQNSSYANNNNNNNNNNINNNNINNNNINNNSLQSKANFKKNNGKIKTIIIVVIILLVIILAAIIIKNALTPKKVTCEYNVKDAGFNYTDKYIITHKMNSILYVESNYNYNALNDEFKNEINSIKEQKVPVIVNSNGMPGFTYIYEISDDNIKIDGYLDFELMNFKEIDKINQDLMPISYVKINSKTTYKSFINELKKNNYKCN